MNPTLKGLDQWPNVAKEERNQPNPDWIPSEAPVVVFGNVVSAPLNLGPKSEPLPETFVQAVKVIGSEGQSVGLLMGMDLAHPGSDRAVALNPEWVTADMEIGGQPTPFSRFWMEQGHSSPVPGIVKKAYQAGFDEGLKTNTTP